MRSWCWDPEPDAESPRLENSVAPGRTQPRRTSPARVLSSVSAVTAPQPTLLEAAMTLPLTARREDTLDEDPS